MSENKVAASIKKGKNLNLSLRTTQFNHAKKPWPECQDESQFTSLCQKGHNFPYVNRCAIVERAPKLLLLLTTRAKDVFSVKHPLMNDRYLLIRRGQKLDEGHNGTTRVAIAFYRLR